MQSGRFALGFAFDLLPCQTFGKYCVWTVTGEIGRGVSLSMTQELSQALSTSTQDAAARLLGDKLGHYEVLEELGQGGMSVVYRARDLRLEREVAIKVLHPFLADRPEAQHRFQREARAVARLHHPNVLEVYDFSAQGATQSYIVTEYVDGLTLRQFAERQAFSPPEVSALIGIKLCAALQCAHDQGIIHRDIKPENIMIDRNGVLKLMDFGIAQLRDASSLTTTGTLLGSPAHMAPELIDGKEIDERADQFSVGTLLYWMATGQLPFTGKNPHALLKKIVEGRYIPAQQANPCISDGLNAIIDRSMRVDPQARYPMISEVQEALLKVLQDGGIDDVDATLASYAQNPAQVSAALRQTVIDSFLLRAQDFEKQRMVAPALAALNRVLALEPDNSQARTALHSLSRRNQRAVMLRNGAKLGLGLALLTLLLFGLWRILSTQNPAEKNSAGTKPILNSFATTNPTSRDPMSSKPSGPWSDGLHAEKHDPISQRHSDDDKTQPVTRAGDLRDKKPGSVKQPSKLPGDRPHLTTINKIDATSAGKRNKLRMRTMNAAQAGLLGEAQVGPSRLVTLRVDPWADIFVDDNGKASIRGNKVAQITLSPGPHQLRFENRYAATVHRQVEIPATGEVQIPPVKLTKMKPAYLIVRGSPDAEVSIDDTYWGVAGESLRNPITITLPDRHPQVRKTIQVSEPGFKPVRHLQRFVAGETVTLDVNLQRSPLPVPSAPGRDPDHPAATAAATNEMQPAPVAP